MNSKTKSITQNIKNIKKSYNVPRRGRGFKAASSSFFMEFKMKKMNSLLKIALIVFFVQVLMIETSNTIEIPNLSYDLLIEKDEMDFSSWDEESLDTYIAYLEKKDS